MNLPIGRALRAGERFRRADVESAWRERRAAIVAEYIRSGSFTETAREFGITYQRVQQIVRAAA